MTLWPDNSHILVTSCCCLNPGVVLGLGIFTYSSLQHPLTLKITKCNFFCPSQCNFFVPLSLFFFFWPHPQHVRFPDQELNPSHSSYPSHSSDNAKSLTTRPPRNSRYNFRSILMVSGSRWSASRLWAGNYHPPPTHTPSWNPHSISSSKKPFLVLKGQHGTGRGRSRWGWYQGTLELYLHAQCINIKGISFCG